MSRTATPASRSSRSAAGERSTRAMAEQPRKKRQQRLIGAAVAAVVLVAVAVFAVQRATPTTQALPASASGSSESSSGPAEVGQPFMDFRLVTVDGAQITPAKLAGNDTLLWFTTTYCVPCQIGAQEYQSLDNELGDKAPTVLFVFLDPQEPDAALSEFRTKFGLPEWQMAMDTDQLAQRAGVQVLDTKIFLDEEGIVRDINTPPVNDAYLESIRKLATT
jgi:cytochrome oxidase Cu insertion factor (SCO1/SenC/PrrC family)